MSAFEVQGKTVTFTGAASPPTAVQCPSNNDVQSPNYILTNIGLVGVFVGWGQTAAMAALNAVIPTGTAQYGYYLLPGSQVTISGPPNAFFTGATASSTSIVYVTPGYGE